MRHLVVTVVAVLVLGVAGSAHATTTQGVNATPYNESYHYWENDGCSWVPDSGKLTATVGLVRVTATWNFHHACMHHDGCYKYHWGTRSQCDSWFRNDMFASCAAMHRYNLAKRAVCNLQSSAYYAGVRAFGVKAYNNWSYLIRIRGSAA